MGFETFRSSSRISSDVISALSGSLNLQTFGRRVASDGALRPPRLSVKRLIDVAMAGVLLVLAAPLLACIMAIIRVSRDGGPVIYRQNRIGYQGRVFACLKFRSMSVNAEQRLKDILASDPDARAEWEATHKLMKDPRVTKIGAFLRATSLDELPQLWNVLRGEMSIVGPRPITAVELDGPYTMFNGRTEYLSVRPGLTGLWQVSGRSLVSYSNRIALDKQYVQNYSVLGDLKILVRTFFIVLLRRGAC